jgi:hypothetical protein
MAAGAGPASIGDGIAKTFAVPASMKPPTSQSANESRRRVKIKAPGKDAIGESRCAIEDFAG